MASPRLQRLTDLWLGTEPAQRLRLRQTSLALGLMVLCVPLLHYAFALGGDDRHRLLWVWTALSLGGVFGFYTAIRSGWSRCLADPSMTRAQIAFALASAALGYALAGPMRGAVFPVLTLILMFGMFQLRAGQAYGLCFYALALFGVSMAGMAAYRPATYPPAVEFGQFLMLACMLPAVAMLTARLSRIRQRLSQQRADLERALVQLEAIATRDDLTGLPNRRQMQGLMDQALARALRHPQHAFCVALLDLDHFKRINDQHGHAAGDAVLRSFAAAGQQAMRATDVLARWGGEEFCVLLPDTPLALAQAGMERLRQHTAALRVPVGGPAAVSLTVSVGLTGYRPGDTLAETLARADRLLYEAKAAGRDRVCSG